MKIAILGTGAYGMALASIFDYNKCNVIMWTNSNEEKEVLLKNKRSDKIDYVIPDDITISTDIKSVVEDAGVIVIAVPAKFVGNVCSQFKDYYKNNQVICIASKGIEQDTCLFLYDVVRNNIKTNNIAVISGGTFAVDIVKKVPIGLSLATRSNSAKDIIIRAMQNNYVKLRHTKDIIGTEICGSIKNVIALSAGMLEGMKANESTKAMLITEAMHDMEEILDAFNCKTRTVLSISF